MPLKIERWNPERTHATAWLVSNRIILHGDCLTTIGGFACEPYHSLGSSLSDAEIGVALLHVLTEVRVTPVPTEQKAVREMISRSSNMRHWSKLSKGFCCSLVQMASGIWILPTRREGRDFTQVLEMKVRIPGNSTPERVGGALRDGFKRCHEIRS
jgi:hypothetical protein